MSLYVLAEIKELVTDTSSSKLIGYRIFDSVALKHMDVSYDSVVKRAEAGTEIRGLRPVEKVDYHNGGKRQIVDFEYTYGSDLTEKQYINTVYKGYPDHSTSYWTVVGKNDIGVIVVSHKGEIKKLTLDWIAYYGYKYMHFNNLRVKDDCSIRFIGDIDNMEITFKNTDESNRVNDKLALVGDGGKYKVDSEGNILILDRTIQNIAIPSHCKEIPRELFRDTLLESIKIGKGVKKIREFAFYNCFKLSEIEIPGNVRNIGVAAFYGCKSLNKVILHEGVNYISSNAFRDCNKLKYIRLPRSINKRVSLTKIFYGRTSKLIVVVPESFELESKEAYDNALLEVRIY